jgi:hypothetical protein
MAPGFPRAICSRAARASGVIDPLRETPFERFFFRDPNGYIFEVVETAHDEPRPIE